MIADLGVLRATEDAVEALVRLDEMVASAPPGLPTLLMLRTAQAIVAANDRPSTAVRNDATPDGDAAFSALLGWWYAPASREFITEDPVLCGVALALRDAAAMIRGGRALTLGMLDDAMHSSDTPLGDLPHAFDSVLRAAESQAWPPLLLCAALSSESCGQLRGIPAAIARTVAPLAGSLTADAFIAPACAETSASSLHALAQQAREVRRRTQVYLERTAAALVQCDEFGRGRGSARQLVELLRGQPATTVALAASTLDLTAPTAGAAVDRLLGAGLLREITGRGRDRVFVYAPAVAIAG